MSFMHDSYLKRSQPAVYCTVGEQPAVDGRSVAVVTNKKVLCVLKLELSPLRLPTPHSISSPALAVSPGHSQILSCSRGENP